MRCSESDKMEEVLAIEGTIMYQLACTQFLQGSEMSRHLFPPVSHRKNRGKFKNAVKILHIWWLMKYSQYKNNMTHSKNFILKLTPFLLT